ncbi:hypothetical protein EDD18DRAFT_1107810 [Armillaria luteobubalina]|uniref:Uncharacterized protein n=1 Tax=Armillaria luteobubalina TaxID=153913 RepID=A0AA39Q2Y4_9AGAR|nr:hypothetical protein EDD18DRAFT_1107810 [Armillaria luteobubalina]
MNANRKFVHSGSIGGQHVYVCLSALLPGLSGPGHAQHLSHNAYLVVIGSTSLQDIQLTSILSPNITLRDAKTLAEKFKFESRYSNTNGNGHGTRQYITSYASICCRKAFFAAD